MTFLKSVLPKIEEIIMLLRPKKCYSFKNIYLFLCLKVIFDTLGSYWLKNSSDFGKVQFCPELSNFSRRGLFYNCPAFLQTLVIAHVKSTKKYLMSSRVNNNNFRLAELSKVFITDCSMLQLSIWYKNFTAFTQT